MAVGQIGVWPYVKDEIRDDALDVVGVDDGGTDAQGVKGGRQDGQGEAVLWKDSLCHADEVAMPGVHCSVCQMGRFARDAQEIFRCAGDA